MISTWIPSHTNLRSHPKLLRLVRLLDVPAVCAVGHLHLLWHWTATYGDEGDLGAFDAGELAFAAEWTGEPQAFVDALAEAGFLDRSDGRLLVHDWSDYFGAWEAKRRKEAERQGKYRSRHRDDSDFQPNHDVTVTSPLRHALEEKRVEEKKEEKRIEDERRPEKREETRATVLPLQEPSRASPLPPSPGGKFKTALARAQTPPAKLIVLGVAFKEAFGNEADLTRLGQLADQVSSGQTFLELMFAADEDDGASEPHERLAARVAKHLNGQFESTDTESSTGATADAAKAPTEPRGNRTGKRKRRART